MSKDRSAENPLAAGEAQPKMDRRLFLLGILVSSAFLLWPYLLNGFPLIYWDTAQYLERWALGIPSFDRPIGYSVWLGLFRGLPFGLYLVPVVQAVVASLLLWACVRHVSRADDPQSSVALRFGLATALLSLSPSALYVATLMPDVATLAAPLAGVVVLASGSWASAALLALLLAAFGHANLPMVLLAGVPAIPLLIRARWRPPWTRVARLLAGAAIGTFLALVAHHLWNGAGLLASPTPVFLAARLDQAGVLATVFLRRCDEATAQPGRPIPNDCDFAQALLQGVRGTPEAFLWDDRSPLNRYWPAWTEDRAQFRSAASLLAPVVKQALLTPETRRAFLVSGFRNVTSLAAGVHAFDGFRPYERADEVVKALEAAAPSGSDAYLGSRQAGGLWHSPLARVVSASAVRVATVTAFVVIFYAIGSSARREDLAILSAAPVFLASFFLSDLVVSGFAASNPARYAERVAALPLIAAVLLPWRDWSWRARTSLLSALLVAAAVAAVGWHLGLVAIASGVVAFVLGATTIAAE